LVLVVIWRQNAWQQGYARIGGAAMGHANATLVHVKLSKRHLSGQVDEFARREPFRQFEAPRDLRSWPISGPFQAACDPCKKP
jgi:hypothetical protein